LIDRGARSSAPAKRALANFALTLAAFAASFALVEAAVRVLYKERTVLFPRYHTDYRYGRYAIRGIRPNADYWMTSVDGSWRVVTNSRGFRNTVEFANPKPGGVLRVLSIGDSHTQGYEVRQDHTFSAVLERYLQRHALRAEVINAGVSGYSTAEALVFLENEGIRYGPDAVVLGFFANDFEDNLKAGLFSLDGEGALTEVKYEHLPGVGLQNAIYSVAPIRWLSENSYFYSLLFNNVWSYFKASLRNLSAAEKDDRRPRDPADELEYAIPTSATPTEYQVALGAALIKRIHRFCAQRGVRFFVVDIPTWIWPNRFESSIPQPLRDALAAERIELIDSRPLLGGYEGIAELHLPRGHHHISEFTHTMIALEIGRRLLAARTPGGPM
jgi:hypothetical protein